MKIKPEITIQNIKINKVLADIHVSMFVCVCVCVHMRRRGGGGGGVQKEAWESVEEGECV